jgi:dihydrofolate reductase
MRRLIYSMAMSLDGYVAGPDGTFDWAAPDAGLHRFHNEQTRELSAHLLGRRLYETMVYWETADQDPELGEIERDFARIWQALPKIVFSSTLEAVEGNARLAKGSLTDEIAELDGDVGVGGAGLAGAAARLGLIDEYGLFVNPVAVGGGTPFFPTDHRIDLELMEARTFGSRVTYLRYRAAGH